MIRLVTFATHNMSKAGYLCAGSAEKNGVNCVWSQNPDTIGIEFEKFNSDVFNQERGYGYWLWKPYFIYKAMLLCDDNDILIYSDAGIEFINPVQEIINRMDQDIFFFTNGFPHVEWCKGSVVVSILGHPEDPFNQSWKQVQASVIFFKVNQKTKDFVKEWLMYSQMPGFIDDSPSKLLNYPTFAEHRHDQAVLTCCAIKNGYTIDHWWPTQYSNHLPRSERDGYPVMFNHHRKRNNEW